MNSSIKTAGVTIVAAALSVLAAAAPARAAEAPARSVAYSDLDLASPAGVDTFNRRVRAAAKAVCGDAPAYRSLAENQWIARCVDETVDSHARAATRI